MMQIEMKNSTEWIKDLVKLEQNMETSGQFPVPETKPPVEKLKEHTIEFMQQLRVAFTANLDIFNQMKGGVDKLRIYGIADSPIDFMLFRHGHKLIFSFQNPGLISIRIKFSNFLLSNNTHTSPSNQADLIKAEWGPFNELQWKFNDQKLNIDYLIRYYMSVFVKNSVN